MRSIATTNDADRRVVVLNGINICHAAVLRGSRCDRIARFLLQREERGQYVTVWATCERHADSLRARYFGPRKDAGMRVWDLQAGKFIWPAAQGPRIVPSSVRREGA
jgi:hypothetical protein